jgi:hypothetical protein
VITGRDELHHLPEKCFSLEPKPARLDLLAAPSEFEELCIWLATSPRGSHVFDNRFKELDHTLRDTEKRGATGRLRMVLFLVQHLSQLRNDFNQW